MGIEGKPGMEHIAPVEEIRDPFIEQQEKKLDDYIKNYRALDGVIRLVQSPHFKSENLMSMIEGWNKEHQEWSGGYVEKEFKGAKGEVLMVKMDKDGNIFSLREVTRNKTNKHLTSFLL